MKKRYSYFGLLMWGILFAMNRGPLYGQTVPGDVAYHKSHGKTKLILASHDTQQDWPGKASDVMRRRMVELNPNVLSPLVITTSDTIEIDLFGGEVCTGTLSRVVVDVNNVLSMSGRIDGTEWGFFYLSCRDGLTLATIEIIEKQKKYMISYDRSAATHFLTEVDPRLFERWDCSPLQVPTR